MNTNKTRESFEVALNMEEVDYLTQKVRDIFFGAGVTSRKSTITKKRRERVMDITHILSSDKHFLSITKTKHSLLKEHVELSRKINSVLLNAQKQ